MATLKVIDRILYTKDASPTDKTISVVAVRAVANDLNQPIPLPKKELARRAGVTRRTLSNRLPEIIRAVLLEPAGDRLRLGTELVK